MLDILSDWRQVTDADLPLIRSYHDKIDYCEFMNSKLMMLYYKMYFKIIDGGLFLLKIGSIHGNFYGIIYTEPIGCASTMSTIMELNNIGVSLRSYTNGDVKDAYGQEYVYDVDDFLKASGGQYAYHRNIIKRFPTTYINGINNDIAAIVENWGRLRGEKHQERLLKTVLKNSSLSTITTTYYGKEPVGFSVVEKINDRYGVIVQRILNYESRSLHLLKEPNFLLHQNDCLQHSGMMLNIGADMNIDGMRVSKKKLVPKYMQQIYRMQSSVKLSKENYYKIKSKVNE